jgi:predicted secreted protein
MNWFEGTVLFVMIWWTALFAVLPIGTHPVSDADDQTGWRGVPANPRIGAKIIGTTILSMLIWLVCYAVITSDWLSFRHGWLAMTKD